MRWSGSAIRWSVVEMVSEPCVSFIFPSIGSICGSPFPPRGPRERRFPASSVLRKAPTSDRPCGKRRRLPRRVPFRGSIARPAHSLCTLRSRGHPRTTQHSVPAGCQPLPARSAYLLGSIERFQLHLILLSQALPGALSAGTRTHPQPLVPAGTRTRPRAPWFPRVRGNPEAAAALNVVQSRIGTAIGMWIGRPASRRSQGEQQGKSGSS